MIALQAATRREVARVPFILGGVTVGSVACAHLPLLAGQPALEVTARQVAWCGPAATRDTDLARLNAQLRASGHIRAWRGELFDIVDPATLHPLAVTERAAARFWGTLTFGAHATGYVAGADGRPTHLWIAQRASTKATDPGQYDNLIGGGVAHGQTPAQALVREGWEEAGLSAEVLNAARPAGVLRLLHDIPEGLQHEWLYSWDLALPSGLQPQNQDGEVAACTRMPAADALALACSDAMTVDAAVVTLDFGLRHRLLDEAQARIAAGLQPLRIVRAPFARADHGAQSP